MKEVNKEFDAKMQKTIDVVMSVFATPPCWTRSPWTTTVLPRL